MQITRAADYAVRVMIHLAALPPGGRANRAALAEAAEVPGEFMSKVLQALTRARLITSHRGAQGGFELARPSPQITMLDVVEAIDGPISLNVCLTGENGCGRRWWCGAHEVWKTARAAMVEVLRAATLDRLAQDSLERFTRLKPDQEVNVWS